MRMILKALMLVGGFFLIGWAINEFGPIAHFNLFIIGTILIFCAGSIEA